MKSTTLGLSRRTKTRKPTCGQCGGAVSFVRMARSGRMMPCDPEMINGDGRRTLITRTGYMIIRAHQTVAGYEPHWGTCKSRKIRREP